MKIHENACLNKNYPWAYTELRYKYNNWKLKSTIKDIVIQVIPETTSCLNTVIVIGESKLGNIYHPTTSSLMTIHIIYIPAS